MTVDRRLLAKVDRRLLSEMDHADGVQLVKVPVSDAVWSTWRRYCDAVGISMGRGLAVLLHHELASVVDEDLDVLGQRLEQRETGIAAREAELLPVPYCHVVFTVPAEIADIAYHNKAEVYDILFKAAAETLITIAADPKHLGARIGFTAVLHTWGSALPHHPHLHCIVPAGGISLDGERWISCRPNFFLPVRVLSKRFRWRFLERLREAHDAGRLGFFNELAPLAERDAFDAHLAPLLELDWVVYARPPVAGPAAGLAYLARYTHRVAISNSRLVACEAGNVSFKYKDYRAKGRARHKTMTLPAHEFIRRFLIHVLPSGFHRIRHGACPGPDPGACSPTVGASATLPGPASCSASQRRRPSPPMPTSPPMPRTKKRQCSLSLARAAAAA